MKIGIFGQHPQLQPGFESAMSLNEAVGFSDAGHSVTLYIPTSPDERADLDALERYGRGFEIVGIESKDDFRNDLDILIWQTYRPALENLRPKRGSIPTTKNFPRFAANSSEKYRRKLQQRLNTFDYLAMSLTADVRLAHEMDPANAERVGYVPRGFNDQWLGTVPKGNVLTFSCDAAVKAEDGGKAALEHMAKLFKHLRRERIKFKVRATRGAADILRADTKILHLPLLEFYKQFFDPAWIYMPCSFEHSVHSQHADFDEAGKKVYIGMFENQIVEAQLAGAIPLYQSGEIDPELVFDPSVCECRNYADIEELAAKALDISRNYETYRARARAYARERFGLQTMVSSWVRLISRAEAVSAAP